MEKIKESKWRWAGHIARTDDNRWTKRLTDWQPRTGKGEVDDRKEDGVTTSQCTWAQQHGDERPVQGTNGYI